MEISKPIRAALATMTISAVGFVAYTQHEGWSGTAEPPVPGDKNTFAFGSTLGRDGKPLKGGEVITPPEGVRLALRDVLAHENALKKCMGDAFLTQYELDALMGLTLNVGTSAVCNSSIPNKARAGDYLAMCRTILDFGKYCTKPKIRDAAGKYVCPPGALVELPGLAKRRKAEYQTCIGANE